MAESRPMAERLRGYAHRVDIAAEVASVWNALTDSAALAIWCSPEAAITAREGGLFRARVDRVTEFEARIDVFEPGRRLRLLYLPNPALPQAESALTDDFLMESTSTGTIVHLLGSGVPGTPDWDTQYLRLRTGWRQAVNRLKIYVEKQRAAGRSVAT